MECGNCIHTEREYVERQLEASKYLDELEKTKESNKRSVSPSDVTFSGTSAKFNGVYQKSNQTSANGCWSVSMSLLLQSRGVDLPQEIIRSFRPNQSADKLDVRGLETPNQDKDKPSETISSKKPDSGTETAETIGNKPPDSVEKREEGSTVEALKPPDSAGTAETVPAKETLTEGKAEERTAENRTGKIRETTT